MVDGFLGNKKDPNYKQLVKKLFKSYQNMGCRMSVKLHFLCSDLDFFQENLCDFSEEHGERFHQDIEPMERRYKGRWDSAIMGDYIWSLIRQDKSGHKRESSLNIAFLNDFYYLKKLCYVYLHAFFFMNRYQTDFCV